MYEQIDDDARRSPRLDVPRELRVGVVAGLLGGVALVAPVVL